MKKQLQYKENYFCVINSIDTCWTCCFGMKQGSESVLAIQYSCQASPTKPEETESAIPAIDSAKPAAAPAEADLEVPASQPREHGNELDLDKMEA